MTHPLVTQLRFTRSEFVRCLDGLSAEDAVRRLEPMNCISWMIGHVANQEQYYWVIMGQGRIVVPGLNERVGYGSPPSTPLLDEMWDVWRTVTTAADAFLDTITQDKLLTYLDNREGGTSRENVGTMLHRNMYHYWFHTGEAYGVRQALGHKNLPEFVGNFGEATYTPE